MVDSEKLELRDRVKVLEAALQNQNEVPLRDQALTHAIMATERNMDAAAVVAYANAFLAFLKQS